MKSLSLMTLLCLVLLTACGGSSSTVSREEFEQLKQSLQFQAEKLELLMSTPTAPASQPTPTETPTQIAPTSQPAAAPVQPMQAENPCVVIHDYQLRDLTEVATSSGNFLHVEYWVGGDAPEYETVLPGGRYLLKTQFAGGHVWEYTGCTFEQVKNQVDAHISRRLAQKANNGGYIEWQKTGFFNPVR